MNIDNFEEKIEPKIIDRGFSYFEQKAVDSFERIGEGEFVAAVYGSEQYSVLISLDENQGIIDHYCSCPYDWGEYCKHRVAVLYCIQYKIPFVNQLGKGGFAILKEAIEQYNAKGLKELILYLAKRNIVFRKELLEAMGHGADDIYW